MDKESLSNQKFFDAMTKAVQTRKIIGVKNPERTFGTCRSEARNLSRQLKIISKTEDTETKATMVLMSTLAALGAYDSMNKVIESSQ